MALVGLDAWANFRLVLGIQEPTINNLVVPSIIKGVS